eukprot:TRINITY_DN27882_c1_g1_i2.p1 TRINITY_DN27882_c1_g1~~TRINITY_DN27882_c1_g1_i2.p1  ORF type:complete len:218 (-),score=2.16 TRINITY_DN27882_c1_g1_i2:136-789(-)
MKRLLALASRRWSREPTAAAADSRLRLAASPDRVPQISSTMDSVTVDTSWTDSEDLLSVGGTANEDLLSYTSAATRCTCASAGVLPGYQGNDTDGAHGSAAHGELIQPHGHNLDSIGTDVRCDDEDTSYPTGIPNGFGGRETHTSSVWDSAARMSSDVPANRATDCEVASADSGILGPVSSRLSAYDCGCKPHGGFSSGMPRERFGCSSRFTIRYSL